MSQDPTYSNSYLQDSMKSVVEQLWIRLKVSLNMMKSSLSLNCNTKPHLDDIGQSKDEQESNIRDAITNLADDTVTIFTDGSSLGNSGPTGGSAIVFLTDLQNNPVLLK